MKKFILLVLLTFTVSAILPTLFKVNEAKAQLVTTLKPEAANDTLTNADTAIVYLNATARSTGDTLSSSVLDNIARSVTIYGKTVSGNPSNSRAYLQGSVDGTNYTTLDSLVFTNTTYNYKTYALRASNGDLLYKTYRVAFYNAPTSVVVPKLYYLRRSN
ncbi:MAG: hypothetical protein IAE96_04785 [Chitinophagaceae bacterium]|nr:hypothetical protein [Chitinophagaceae bacterium]